MLILKDVSLTYDRQILHELSLTVGKGEILGIIGRSGIGKSSLLKVSAGLLDPTSGEILFDGQRIIGPSVKLVPGYDEIQLVNQDFALDLYHTVEENVREMVLNLPKSDQRYLIDEVLDVVELNHIRSQKAHLLSGGEQQRLALARSLACEPKMLLLDEPFAHLDQRLRLRVMEYLLQLNELRNVSVVIVSHDGAELMGFVDRIIHMNEEGIVRSDTPENMFLFPTSIEEGELLGVLNTVVDSNGDVVFFRPTQYSLEEGDRPIKVRFVRSINNGMVILNYFVTFRDEKVILYSNRKLSEVTQFFIDKKWID